MRAFWTVGSFCVVSLVLGCNDGDSGGNEGGAGGGSGSGASAGRGGSGGGSAGRAGTNATGGAAGKGGSGGAAGGSAGTGSVVTYGQKYEGGEFHLGPVDWEESEWSNACAPATKYAAAVREAEGQLLAGIWNGVDNHWRYCDACIYVTTARGKSAMLRVVTYGDTSPNSIDVSPRAYDILNSGEYPRNMSWQFAKCPDTGEIIYEFKAGTHEFWSAFWVRNARIPIRNVEVKSVSHVNFTAMPYDPDGSLNAPGFGIGPFTIRVTGIDGQQISDTFAWPSGGIAQKLLTGQGNFR